MILFIGSLTIGLILSLLGLGVFISFRIFNFADITVDGSLTLGAAVAARLIWDGYPPLLATFLAALASGLAGAVTGILNTRFKINSLLSGILVMTALYSINLHVMGKSNIPLMQKPTLIRYAENFGESFFGNSSPSVFVLGWEIAKKDLSVLLFAFLLLLFCSIALYLFLNTHLGGAMRASGANEQMTKALGINLDYMIIMGIAVSNSLAGLAGALMAQYQGFADIQMGIGMVIWGLASVIIGEALVNSKDIDLAIIGTIMGSILFRLLVAIALRWGLNPNDLKLATALFVFASLVIPSFVENIKQRLGRPVNA
ncbi:MAG: ABC transporter permease [Candidatus Ozemobacteraceae bacterium]